MTCDVCILTKGDHGEKAGVAYCSKCDAWLCRECRESGLTVEGVTAIKNRAVAALARLGLIEGRA